MVDRLVFSVDGVWETRAVAPYTIPSNGFIQRGDAWVNASSITVVALEHIRHKPLYIRIESCQGRRTDWGFVGGGRPFDIRAGDTIQFQPGNLESRIHYY
jgi:hypothetical protein